MESFRYISVVLSMVLGLGVTRLLLGSVAVFRARRLSKVDWIPLAWAAILFLVQLEYWWALNHLPATAPSFTFFGFVSLVMLTLLLFASAALLLPSSDAGQPRHMREFFEDEGRYGLVPLAAFYVFAAAANSILFGTSLISEWGLLDIPLIAIPLLVFYLRSRSIQAALTLTYFPLIVYDVILSTAMDV